MQLGWLSLHQLLQPPEEVTSGEVTSVPTQSHWGKINRGSTALRAASLMYSQALG